MRLLVLLDESKPERSRITIEFTDSEIQSFEQMMKQIL